MTLSKVAAAQLVYDLEFEYWTEKEGLRNPFKISSELFKKKCKKNKDGSWTIYNIEYVDPEEPTDTEKKVYRMINYMYVLDKIYAILGYEAALDRVQLWNEEIIRQYFETLKPCESAERQCDMRCKYFLECEDK